MRSDAAAARSCDGRPGARRVALHWHFDRHGVVSAMVLQQLARYRDAGFAVVFIAMAPIFATLRAAGDGVCRMTESAQGGHHMRSCFVLARGQKAVAALAAEPDACPGRCLVRRLGFPFVKPTPLRRHPVGLPGEEASTIRSCHKRCRSPRHLRTSRTRAAAAHSAPPPWLR